MGQLEGVGPAGPVVRLQQPLGGALLDLVGAVARQGLGDLGEQGLGVGEHDAPQLALLVRLGSEGVGV